MIELAPNWKRGLALKHPLMIVAHVWDAAPLGALVTPPLTARPRAGAPLPRVIEFPGGFLLRTGAANPGVSAFTEQHRLAWRKSDAPIIVALAAQAAGEWHAIAARLARVDGVGGVELHLNPGLDTVKAIRRTRAATDLPILAKLDLENARAIASECVAAGANALVVGRAPRGAAMRAGRLWRGRMYGAFVTPFALQVLSEIAALRLDVPLIACGGVHTARDAREMIAAGAVAVQIDTAHWVDAEGVAEMCEELRQV